jgi:hypothetical protein
MTINKEWMGQQGKIESYFERLSSIGIVFIDSDLKIRGCNLGFNKMFQLRRKPLGVSVTKYLPLQKCDLQQPTELKLACDRVSSENGILHCWPIKTEKGCLLFCERPIFAESLAVEQIGNLNSELINMQRELLKKNLQLEKLKIALSVRIEELESAFSRVKHLEGIIPICMYCKKIRENQDDWQGLEQYISKHSEAHFSHGICPACLEKKMMESRILKDELKEKE